MTLDRERLAAIDDELAGFGKPEAELERVRDRAVELAAQLADVDAALGQLGPEPTTDKHPVMERIQRTSDIAGLTVDELFADAEPAASDGLDGLFDDQPLSLTESEAGLDLSAELDAGDFESDSGRELARSLEPSSPDLGDELEPFGEDDDEATSPRLVRETSPSEPPDDTGAGAEAALEAVLAESGQSRLAEAEGSDDAAEDAAEDEQGTEGHADAADHADEHADDDEQADDEQADDEQADDEHDDDEHDDEQADDEQADDEQADDEQADDEQADDEHDDEQAEDERDDEQADDEQADDEQAEDEQAEDERAAQREADDEQAREDDDGAVQADEPDFEGTEPDSLAASTAADDGLSDAEDASIDVELGGFEVDIQEPEPPLARPRTMPPPVPSASIPPPVFAKFGEDEDEATQLHDDFEEAPPSDEFELLVDEDILELDDSDVEEIIEDGPGDPGLISGIFGGSKS